ncbi:MAG TPA: DUF1499 domain-containing protein [Candidatus Limnocylindrales bacterium]|nr:DUF1499 domain-containing protein [Candidatus Limnocylindrales bacterium]
MDNRQGAVSRAAHSGFVLAVAAAVLGLLGFGSAYAGILPGFTGFLVMALGLLTGIAALILSIVGLSATRPHKGRTGGNRARQGLVLSVAVIGLILAPAIRVGNVPRINDITTDPADPPAFVAAAQLEENRGRDMAYPGEAFAAQQREGYPDLKPVEMAVPPAVAFDKARAALASMDRMEIIGESKEEGRIEAVQTTRLFKFKDDIVVRIRPHGDGSRIDARSKSRVGKGDQGANADRIRELFELMRWK